MRKAWAKVRGRDSRLFTPITSGTPVAQPEKAAGFSYISFKNPSREIRLLQWEKHLSDPFRLDFRMITVSLDDDVSFIALSYSWGDPRPVQSIRINGCALPVTANLYRFLSTYTSMILKGEFQDGEQQSILFWVDAVCINQNDVPEKNEQVPLMGELYSKARTVLAYIGDCPQSTDPVAGLMVLVAMASTNLVDPTTGLPLSEVPAHAPTTLRGIADQPWYMRSWVTQEMVLAQKVLCLYGNASKAITVDRVILAGLVDRIQARQHHNPRYGEFFDDQSNDSQVAGLRRIDAWHQLRKKYIENELSAIEVMRFTRPTAATDLRDKVYSVLALMPESYQTALKPDYSPDNSVQHVLKSLARCMVLFEDRIDLLYDAGTRQKVPGLPSWVPDWTCEPRLWLNPANYKATGMLSVLPADVSLSDDGDAISLSGILWDMVDYVHVGVSHPPDPEDVLSTMGSFEFLSTIELSTYNLCQDLREKNGRYPCNASNVDDVILRTLVADTAWSSDGKAGDAERAAYDAFLSTRPRGDPQTHLNLLKDLQVREQCFGLWLLTERHFRGRMLATTRLGDIAVLPNDARVGDVIVAFLAGSMPFVIRPVGQNGRFQLVGPCFVYGHMDGFILFALNQEAGGWSKHVERITLV